MLVSFGGFAEQSNDMNALHAALHAAEVTTIEGGESGEPAEVSDPVESGVPVEPTDPTQPMEPAQPTESGEPTAPADSAEPTQPAQPSETTQPSEPAEPAESAEPANPDAPAETVPDGEQDTEEPTEVQENNETLGDAEPTDVEIIMMLAAGALEVDPRAGDCTHPEGQHTTGSEKSVDYNTVLRQDGANHYYSAQIVSWTECGACGAILDYEITAGEEEEAHWTGSSSDYCWVCGYQLAEIEPHEHEPIEYTQEACIYIDKDKHRSVTYIMYESPCAICGEAIPAEDLPPAKLVKDEYQDHFYDPWSGDRCYCGAVKEDDCEHMYISERYEEVGYKAGATPLDENQHLREIEYITVDQICDSCGAYLGYYYDYGDGGTRTAKEAHTMVKTENGMECSICGYAKECAHENTVLLDPLEHMDYVENGAKFGYTDLGDGKHSYKQWLNEVIQCQDCGLIYAGDTYIATRTETHTINEEGTYCFDCDKEIEPETICWHADGLQKRIETYSEEPFAKDALTHVTVTYVTTHWYCPLCGDSWSESDSQVSTIAEEHSYGEDGVCAECGYTRPECDHTGEKYYRYGDSLVKYTQMNAEGHTYEVSERTIEYCQDCGEVLSDEYVLQFKETAPHNNNGSGICIDCGWVTQCAHENTDTFSDYPAEWNRISATPTEDGYLHDARYNIATTVSCVDCGTVLGVTYAEKVYGEPHNLNNIGVCTVCGYTCEHGQINENDTPPEPTYENNYDGKTHTKTTYVTPGGYCLICGIGIRPETEKITEDHTYAGGVCPCGQEESPYCAHTGLVWELQEGTPDHYENQDGQCVAVGLEGRWQGKCRLCGEVLERYDYDETYRAVLGEHLIVGNACTRCGYAPGCAHENALLTSNQNEPVGAAVDNGDGTHTATVARTPYYSCPDCGAAFNGPTTVVENYRQAHTYNENGLCSACGAKNACTHAGAVLLAETWAEANILSRDENMHTLLCDGVISYYMCPICLAMWDEEIDVGQYTQTEPHNFDEMGVCLTCGYAISCGHANTAQETYTESLGIGGSGNLGHNWRVREVTVTTCEDCGAVLEKNYGQIQRVDEYHVWNTAGHCEVCDYENPCQHPNAVFVPADEGAPVPDFDSYEPIDATKHRYTYSIYGATVCPDCEQIIGQITVGQTGLQGEEDHAFDEVTGVCALCGYTPAAVCQHTATREVRTNTTAYISLSDIKHQERVDTKISRVCENCGETVSVETKTGTPGAIKTHTYETVGEDHVCSLCEHTCGHTSVAYGEPVPEETPFSYTTTSTQHTPVYKATRTDTCNGCGEQWTDNEVTVEGIAENHTFKDGVCEVCQYECEHSWGEGSPIEGEPTGEYETSDATHAPIIATGTKYTCSICGDVKVEGGETETGEAVSHTYEGGKCTECGHECKHSKETAGEPVLGEVLSYETNDAQHTPTYKTETTYTCEYCDNKRTGDGTQIGESEDHTYALSGEKYVCSVCQHECAHAGAEVTKDTKFKEYTDLSDATHTKVNTVTTTTECKYCDYVNAVPVDEKAEPETHTYEGGKCTVCGYECKHSKETAGEPVRGEVDSYAADDAQHTPTYKTETTYTCDYCDNERTEDGTQVGESAAHTYVESDGKYVCSVCQHECAHTGAEVTKDTKVKEYTDLSDATHTKVNTVTTTTECKYCAYVNTASVDEKAEPEAHTYADGVCTVCQYACKHSQETAGEPVRGEVLSYETDDAQHTPTYKTKTTYTCDFCGTERTQDGTQKGEPEAHTYEDGKCTVCKYECKHDATTDTYQDVFDAYTAVDGDDKNHTASGTRVTTTTCNTCGTETNVTEPAPYEEAQPHTYVDGVCTLCKHECGHSEPQSGMVFVATSYQSNGSSGHTATGDIHEITTCKCCNLTIEDTVYLENQTQVEEHVFSGRTCRLCGYTRPETQEDDVVVDEPIFTDLDADEALHGVSAGEAVRMATALASVSEDIYERYGEDVTVSVVYSDEVLTADELEALNALEPAERMFVLLSVLGYENEVNHTLETWEHTLSDEAAALVAAVRARIEAMTDEERAAFDALVEDCFPLRKTAVDGEECDYVEITLEIRIRLEAGYRLERYGFCESDGVWLLTKISVAGVDG